MFNVTQMEILQRNCTKVRNCKAEALTETFHTISVGNRGQLRVEGMSLL